MLLFPLIVQMGVCKSLPTGEEVPTLTSSDSEHELFFPIASNRNGQESNRNLKVMMGATKAQLPR
jgi:hypothetical protein